MTVDLDALLAILAMAVATIATRIGGLILIRYVTIGENQKRALEAIPPAVLMAVIAPTALVTGPPKRLLLPRRPLPQPGCRSWHPLPSG